MLPNRCLDILKSPKVAITFTVFSDYKFSNPMTKLFNISPTLSSDGFSRITLKRDRLFQISVLHCFNQSFLFLLICYKISLNPVTYLLSTCQVNSFVLGTVVGA